MSASIRLASATAFDNTVTTLAAAQIKLSEQQNRVASGQRVMKASDDPIAAASTERALTRISQLQAEQRSLNVQRNAMATAESTLGNAGTLMQRFRELAVSAGNTTNNATDRSSIASEMQSIRDQVFSLANSKDSNGIYLFSGLESAKVQNVTTAAFTTTGAPPNLKYQYNGTAGQNLPTQNAVPFTLDGDATWMQVPKGNGVYDVTLGAANTGRIATDAGQFSITPLGSTMTNQYQLRFTVPAAPGGNVTTYDVLNTVGPGAPSTLTAAVPFVAGQPITITAPNAAAGTETVTLTVNGVPANGDTVGIAPYDPAGPLAINPANASLFELMDKAINGINNSASSSPSLAQTIAQALSRVDSGMTKLSSARAQSGIWLNQADAITSSNEAQSTQAETDRSSAQDLDMVKGISDMEKMKIGYQAALQSYSSIQKLSLFDYIR